MVVACGRMRARRLQNIPVHPSCKRAASSKVCKEDRAPWDRAAVLAGLCGPAVSDEAGW